jgi:hypothetical protein
LGEGGEQPVQAGLGSGEVARDRLTAGDDRLEVVQGLVEVAAAAGEGVGLSNIAKKSSTSTGRVAPLTSAMVEPAG